MEILSLFLIGIGLSMDAFSLAICYGTLNLPAKKEKLLSLIVGTFHFFMPLLGMLTGHLLKNFVSLDFRYVIFTIFMVIGYEMLDGALKKEVKLILLNSIGLFIFGFTVSIDSFSAGIGIEFISDKHLLCSLIFSFTSASFTFIGLKLGGKLNEKFKNLSQIAGSIILMCLSIYYLFK
jgi:putative Mn2+ efflux pump MntP